MLSTQAAAISGHTSTTVPKGVAGAGVRSEIQSSKLVTVVFLMTDDSIYRYTDRDGVGIQDPAIRAYGCRFLGMTCRRAGAWKRGKALVVFEDGTQVVVRARLLRKLPP